MTATPTTGTSPGGPAGGSELWLDMIQASLAPEMRGHHWATPGQMAKALDRATIQTPALDLIDEHLVAVRDGRIKRLILNLPPQEGKSERTSRRFPEWILQGNPNTRIGIVSFGHDVARRWGRKIRDDLKSHPEIGLTLSESTKAQHEFELLGYQGGVVCVGIQGGLTSRPVDLLIVDDPYKDAKQADSETWQQTVRDFWTEVALPRLAPGAPVVIIQTRWRQDDLSGWLQAGDNGDEWRVLNIPAQADYDPGKGETDPLGRQPGEYLTSARGRTVAEWDKKKLEVGSRSWTALYQGRPSPSEGGIFKRDDWQQYTAPLWIDRADGARIVPTFDELLISWDMTFKDTAGTDNVVGQVWMRRGADAFLLDQVCDRMDFVRTLREFRQLAAKWPQALLKLVEDKANGPAVIAMLGRQVPGIVPEEPHGSKTARAAAVSPLVEARNVWLPSPELAPWVGAFVEECAGFPNAQHDDQVDAMTQALRRLVLQPLLAGEDLVSGDDLDEELAEFGAYLPRI